jgi:hypothetical protein
VTGPPVADLTVLPGQDTGLAADQTVTDQTVTDLTRLPGGLDADRGLADVDGSRDLGDEAGFALHLMQAFTCRRQGRRQWQGDAVSGLSGTYAGLPRFRAVAIADGIGDDAETARLTPLVLRWAVDSARVAGAERGLRQARRRIQGHWGDTTLVVATIDHDGRVQVAWTGDSRAFLVREGRQSWALHQVTRDHTEAVARAAWQPVGVDDHAWFDRSRLAQRLTSHLRTGAIGTATARLDEPDVRGLLLCTDGVTGSLRADVIASILRQVSRHTGDPGQAVRQLVEMAVTSSCSSGDNAAAVFLPVGPLPSPRIW